MSFPPVDDQLAVLMRGVADLVPEDELRKKLEHSRKTDTPLRVKLGCDPSRPDLHLGHTVVLRKLRQFQDLGHQAVLIVGDFTGMIGDPTGRSKTRPALTLKETREHGKSYFEQASKVLDPEQTEIRYNSEWLDEMSFSEVIELSAQFTVARMLEREDFKTRYEVGKPISVHEFLYPLAQAQDSVEIRSDVELGGTDQRFNLLVGRHIQQAEGQDPQVCLMVPLLEGTDGHEKMSKSLDNAIGITEAPEEMYGKVMSVPDELIYRYTELITDTPLDELPAVKERADENPRDAKHELAHTIVRMYHDEDAAEAARAYFEKTVVQGATPDDIETFVPETANGEIGLLNLMTNAGLTDSNSEARRLIKQGAVTIDDATVQDWRHAVDVQNDLPFVLQVGKRRYARIERPGA
ncbi:MAG: tyrosine--tRNA ligase [Longimonas sp.]|uniref:tyrosine--tRNA ligase n=1 Tax=Longimonas sp. TaxID=2039626 RepID=UPI00334B38BA